MTRVHFIGIGGSGLSAIARLLLESGYTVTGSDRTLSPLAADLQKLGALVHIGHAAAHIAGADWVVRSSAIPDDNPEVAAARGAGIPVYKRADFLGRLMQDKIGVAVAGTHGKTTTTAMLAWVLTRLGADPSFIVGGVVSNLGVNARFGQGAPFVIEADEYDRMFLGLSPRIAVITNVEHDHPDCYPTPEDFFGAFYDFTARLPADGVLVACGDDPGARDVAAHARALGKKVVLYGAAPAHGGEGSEWVLARDLQPNNAGGFSFTASVLGEKIMADLQVPGVHNVRNALGVLAAVKLIGLPAARAAGALAQFTGAGRRFDVRGEVEGITVVDDYGHHPTEIRTTLAAARARYPGRRIWAAWQPHTYSRTQLLFQEFAMAFEDADQVLVTEIYKSREPEQDFSSRTVVEAMGRPAARFSDTLGQTTAILNAELRPGDVLIVFSAGDADQVSAAVLEDLKKKHPAA